MFRLSISLPSLLARRVYTPRLQAIAQGYMRESRDSILRRAHAIGRGVRPDALSGSSIATPVHNTLPPQLAPLSSKAHPRASRTTRALRPVISATAEGPPSLHENQGGWASNGETCAEAGW